MMWFIWVWAVSIFINAVICLIIVKKDRITVTFPDLLHFFIFGTVVAPALTVFILVCIIIKYYNKLRKKV